MARENNDIDMGMSSNFIAAQLALGPALVETTIFIAVRVISLC